MYDYVHELHQFELVWFIYVGICYGYTRELAQKRRLKYVCLSDRGYNGNICQQIIQIGDHQASLKKCLCSIVCHEVQRRKPSQQ